jgi:hypothetical protein
MGDEGDGAAASEPACNAPFAEGRERAGEKAPVAGGAAELQQETVGVGNWSSRWQKSGDPCGKPLTGTAAHLIQPPIDMCFLRVGRLECISIQINVKQFALFASTAVATDKSSASLGDINDLLRPESVAAGWTATRREPAY